MNDSQLPDNGAYIPSRAEIREKCREIRRTWSNPERTYRYWLARTDSWTISARRLREMQAARIHVHVKLVELAEMVA